MRATHSHPDRLRLRPRRSLIAVDAVMVAWVAAWVFVAIRVAFDVRSLGQLPVELHSTGHAVAATGGALAAFGHIPFVGHSLGKLGNSIAATGKHAESTASSSANSVSQLSILLPVVVAIVPVVPVLIVYLPLRVQRWRETRAVVEVMRVDGVSEARRFLAHRAVTTLSFHRLESVSEDPWGDLEAERYEALADAELERLGIGALSNGRPR